jgi:hypothetical protein
MLTSAGDRSTVELMNAWCRSRLRASVDCVRCRILGGDVEADSLSRPAAATSVRHGHAAVRVDRLSGLVIDSADRIRAAAVSG